MSSPVSAGHHPPGVDLHGYAAVLFDLDGVLTPTAEVHMRAWERMFSEFLAGRGVAEPYTDNDYFDYVDGKPRYEGVRSFLKSRGIDLPEGTPDDSPEAETVCGLGNRKNDLFAAVLATDGVQPYAGSLELLDELRDGAPALAVVSSSKNAAAVLDAAGLADRFSLVVDGTVAAAEGLPGKPAPDTFEFAARRLGAPVNRSIVIEDAISGVQAGCAGGFGLVIGVDRGVGPERLHAAGADLVVADLAELVKE
ncbi:HAD family hydrolase [Microlunatus speluncae]|uniref:HAD family hydrolase n=1 Tax=Microlunatus speluncae TaxID=2594267 RepID=UPI0012662C9F|nr:beta-phosphoglucomutase family hydrolase [Microlunatus speluncae]